MSSTIKRFSALVCACLIVLGSTAAAASATVVLGSPSFTGGSGAGWGTAHPATISNGGDLSGLIEDVSWEDWGAAVATGHGRKSIFKPSGGYYRRQVRVKLRAREIGPCAGHRAYRQLEIRTPGHPGGPLGPWLSWSEAASICTFGF